MSKCEICGKLGEDLFSFVTQEPVCSLCKAQFIGGLPTTAERIAQAREELGLKPGQYFQQDRLAVARAILGRP